MRVDIGKITSAIAKVTALTSDIKAVPGVLLELAKTEGSETGVLKVCFSDGHKSVIEEIEVNSDENDKIGGIVVDYSLFKRAIDNCQPSGIIKVGEILINYKENLIEVCADQFFEVLDGEGNIVDKKKMASKKIDVYFTLPGSDMKSAILSRMKYSDIFEATDNEGNSIEPDVFDKKVLMDALSRTSVEKGKQIYISTKTQNVFVANQAHLTSVPVDGYEVSQETKDEIAGTLAASNQYTEESFADACKKASNRIHYSISMSQAISKSIIDILNKTDAETVNVYTKDKYCNIYIDADGEKVGIWFEMAPASKTHLGALERYTVLKYQNYQLMFLREFLVDLVKSALNATKSEKVAIKFVPTTNENPTSPLDMIVESGSSSSSTSDVYSLNPESLIDANNDLQGKEFKVSLKVISDMLAQVKTQRVALDFNIGIDSSVCIRISEINDEKLAEAFNLSRKEAQETYRPEDNGGQPFDINSTPTPISIKMKYFRADNVIVTRQYTMIAN